MPKRVSFNIVNGNQLVKKIYPNLIIADTYYADQLAKLQLVSAHLSNHHISPLHLLDIPSITTLDEIKATKSLLKAKSSELKQHEVALKEKAQHKKEHLRERDSFVPFAWTTTRTQPFTHVVIPFAQHV